MARLARIVVPGRPHHVTQRGNQREAIFFEDGDQAIYLDLLAEQTTRYDVQVWAYCLMPNHVHLILVPAHADALGLAVGEAHRRYTNFIHARGRWSGHLFQSRFASVVLDDDHFLLAVGYVSLNPVRARLKDAAEQWPWSSVRAHLAGADDTLVRVNGCRTFRLSFRRRLTRTSPRSVEPRRRGDGATARHRRLRFAA